MTFAEMREAIRNLPCLVNSDAVGHYLEIVIEQSDVQALNTILENYFGPPIKKAGETVTDEIDRITGRYGGVQVNQTAYAKKTDTGYDVALLWPWANKVSVTIKVINAK